MRLLVIVPDSISVLLEKGEYQPLYYNPGELADEVHLLLVNDDKPDKESLRWTVGKADLYIHNFPSDPTLPVKRFSFLDGWRLNRWAEQGVHLARTIMPDLIRCHNADWCAYLAYKIKEDTGIPYCISFHGNPDVDYMGGIIPFPRDDAEIRRNKFYRHMEKVGVANADRIMPVYSSILPYLDKFNFPNGVVRPCYNVLDAQSLLQKSDYKLHSPVRLIWVSRMCPGEKDPENIIRALQGLEGVEMTFVGQGPLLESKQKLAESLGLAGKVSFIPSMKNSELCRVLAKQDLFVIQSQNWEISKAMLEALLTGLPAIINHRNGGMSPEFEEGDFVHFVDNTPESYRAAIQHFIDNGAEREALGRRAYTHARARWDPKITEAVYVDIYKELLGKAHV